MELTLSHFTYSFIKAVLVLCAIPTGLFLIAAIPFNIILCFKNPTNSYDPKKGIWGITDEEREQIKKERKRA